MKLFGIRVPFTSEDRSGSVADDRYFTGSSVVYLGDEIPVTPQTAVTFTPVFAAVRVIAGNLAGLPLVTYKRQKDGGKEKALNHPLYRLLKSAPNKQKTTSFEFRELLTGHMLLYGNGYAQIIRNGLGDPLELYPLHPTRVKPEVREGEVVYRYQQNAGQEVILPAESILHLRAYRDSGLEGLSPIAAARKAIEGGLSLESFSANFFQGGAFPSGVLEYEGGALSDVARKNLRESWQELYGGANRGKSVAVLEAGVKWKPMGIPQSDAQFLEQRRFSVEEIARIYGVPPHLLGDLSRSTNNNIETQSQEFLTYCLRPWMERWEQAIVRDLLEGDDERYFVKHVANALLRGDSAARGQFYSQGRQWGWFSINDIRGLEDLNPIGPEGDVYLSPLNMVPAGEEGKQHSDPAPQASTDTAPADSSQKDQNQRENEPFLAEKREENEVFEAKSTGSEAENRVKEAFRGAFRETWQRVVRKEIGAIKAAARKKGGEFDPWFDEFVADHHAFADECVREMARSYCILRGLELDSVLPTLLDEYRTSVRDRVEAWKAEPARGYNHREDELATYWAERLLGYSVKEYETAA